MGHRPKYHSLNMFFMDLGPEMHSVFSSVTLNFLYTFSNFISVPGSVNEKSYILGHNPVSLKVRFHKIQSPIPQIQLPQNLMM